MRHRLFALGISRPWAQRISFRTVTSLSRAGFDDYEAERSKFKWNKPKHFNFTRDIFDKWANKVPQHKALWIVNDKCDSIEVTYGKMSELSMRLANGLQHACGLKPGSRVIMILPRIPEWWILNLSCTRTGIVFCPGTTLLTAKDINSRLNSSNADAIIIDDTNMHKVQEIEENHPHLTKICVTGNNCPTGWWKFSDLMDKGSATHQCVDTLADDPMSLYFTSGTTGLPKMVEHTHASQGLGHIVTGRYWLDLTENDIMWTNADTGWAKAAYSMVFGPWSVGATVFTHNTPQFDPETTLKVLQDYPITTFCSPPTIYRFLVQQDLTKYDMKSVSHAVSAAEPLNPEVREEWKSGTGLTLLEGYGQSETTLCCGTFLCTELRPGSMGKATPGFEMDVVDDEGRVVEPFKEGNLAIRVAPNRPVGLFTHYVDDPERTQSVFVGDYYLTGDRAYKDDDSYYWFVGRNDDVILSAGYRIGPFEVESALIEHPAVLESAVVSSPDHTRGEIVKAFVVLSQQYKNADTNLLTQELQNHVKQTTAPYKYPRKVEFVEQLPKTVSGKTRRVELREQEWRKKQ